MSVFWPGEFHELYSPWGCKESDTTEQLSLTYLSFKNASLLKEKFEISWELPKCDTKAWSGKCCWKNGTNRLISESESEVAQSCLTLCDPMDCSLPGSSLHGILQARVLEWIAISFSRGSSQPRDRTRVSLIPGRRFNLWATREAPVTVNGIYWNKLNPLFGLFRESIQIIILKFFSKGSKQLISATVRICKALPTFLHPFAMTFKCDFWLHWRESREKMIQTPCQILPSAGNFLKCNFGLFKTIIQDSKFLLFTLM